MNKQKSHAFGKDCYLLGKDKHGELIWLEAAKWDCDWYWGFGYVEVYTNQTSPSAARDISSHSHIDCLLWQKVDGDYKHHFNEVLQESVLTDSESWQLADLLKTFYTLKSSAELYHKGSSGLTSTSAQDFLKDKGKEDEINKVILPQLFKEIYRILDPELQAKAA